MKSEALQDAEYEEVCTIHKWYRKGKPCPPAIGFASQNAISPLWRGICRLRRRDVIGKAFPQYTTIFATAQPKSPIQIEVFCCSNTDCIINLLVFSLKRGYTEKEGGLTANIG